MAWTPAEPVEQSRREIPAWRKHTAPSGPPPSRSKFALSLTIPTPLWPLPPTLISVSPRRVHSSNVQQAVLGPSELERRKSAERRAGPPGFAPPTAHGQLPSQRATQHRIATPATSFPFRVGESDCRGIQAMDTDNSGGLDSREFCIAMKKLVSGCCSLTLDFWRVAALEHTTCSKSANFLTCGVCRTSSPGSI